MAKNRHLSKTVQDELFLEEMSLMIAELYLVKRLTQSQIAAELGVSQATVSNHIKKIRYEYGMKRLNKYQVYLNEELFKLETVEKEAWAAWERSVGRSKKVVTRKDGSGNVIDKTITVDELPGDPRYLTAINATVDRRIRLLGLDQPQEIVVNTLEGKLSRLIIEGKVTFDTLTKEVGRDQATRYFNLAGVDIPDIIEGQYQDNEDDNFDYTNLIEGE